MKEAGWWTKPGSRRAPYLLFELREPRARLASYRSVVPLGRGRKNNAESCCQGFTISTEDSAQRDLRI